MAYVAMADDGGICEMSDGSEDDRTLCLGNKAYLERARAAELKLREIAAFVESRDRMEDWDAWRKVIADGNRGSWPRDCYEASLSWISEAAREGGGKVTHARIAELETDIAALRNRLASIERETIERCAKIVEYPPQQIDGRYWMAGQIAAALRALIEVEG
jgi:hypothetical protein